MGPPRLFFQEATRIPVPPPIGGSFLFLCFGKIQCALPTLSLRHALTRPTSGVPRAVVLKPGFRKTPTFGAIRCGQVCGPPLKASHAQLSPPHSLLRFHIIVSGDRSRADAYGEKRHAKGYSPLKRCRLRSPERHRPVGLTTAVVGAPQHDAESTKKCIGLCGNACRTKISRIGVPI